MHGQSLLSLLDFVDDGFGYSVCSHGLTPTFLSFMLVVAGTLTILVQHKPIIILASSTSG